MRWPYVFVLIVQLASALPLGKAAAWGDEGHQIIALIAEEYLEPATRSEVIAMLGASEHCRNGSISPQPS